MAPKAYQLTLMLEDLAKNNSNEGIDEWDPGTSFRVKDLPEKQR